MSTHKIAAMVQAYHRPANLKRLLDRLNGPLWHPIVHLDAKSDRHPFSQFLTPDNTTSLRVPVRWGGISSVKSILLLLREALKRTDASHFYLMSGQCYPIKSDDEIASSISAVPFERSNWIARRPMPAPDKPIERITMRWPHDLPTPIIRRVAGAIFRRLPEARLPDRIGDLEPRGGSAWWILERNAAVRTVEHFDRNPQLLLNLKYSFIPDEWLIQTITHNLGIKASGPGPTATLWNEGSPHPEIVTRKNLALVSRGPEFFARKFLDFYPSDR